MEGEEKVLLDIVALVRRDVQSYALILKEKLADRFLGIVLGEREGFSIEAAWEGTPLPRPNSHDLICSIIAMLGQTLTEVVITGIQDGVFLAKLVFKNGIEVNARPSDAVAIAVRVRVPLFSTRRIMEEHHMIFRHGMFFYPPPPARVQEADLQTRLNEAIRGEEYEKAAEIKRQLKKLGTKPPG